MLRIILFVSMLTLVSARAQQAAKPRIYTTDLGSRDVAFLVAAAEAGAVQVRMGGLGETQAESPTVKEFVAALARHHAAQNSELQQLAANKGVPLPDEADQQHGVEINKLSKLKGPQFEKAAMDAVIAVQQKEISAFEQAAQSGDPEVKAFARKSLPPLKEQQLLAKRLTGAVGTKPASAPGFRANVPGR